MQNIPQLEQPGGQVAASVERKRRLGATPLYARLERYASFSFVRFEQISLSLCFPVCMIALAVFLLMAPGCGTTHATLDISAPPTAIAGVPFTITITTLYEGAPDPAINSSITFTSSDPGAVLPGLYYFTAADAGSHTWTNGVTLNTPGTQTISASVVLNPGLNGTATILVSREAGNH